MVASPDREANNYLRPRTSRAVVLGPLTKRPLCPHPRKMPSTSSSNPSNQSAGSRRRSLEKLRAAGGSKGQAGGGAVVVVDETKFDRYITGVPRQYEAVVFFTAAGANYKCTSCRFVRHDVEVAQLQVCPARCRSSAICISQRSSAGTFVSQDRTMITEALLVDYVTHSVLLPVHSTTEHMCVLSLGGPRTWNPNNIPPPHIFPRRSDLVPKQYSSPMGGPSDYWPPAVGAPPPLAIPCVPCR